MHIQTCINRRTEGKAWLARKNINIKNIKSNILLKQGKPFASNYLYTGIGVHGTSNIGGSNKKKKGEKNKQIKILSVQF